MRDLKHLALAEPKFAPYSATAVEVLIGYDLAQKDHIH